VNDTQAGLVSSVTVEEARKRLVAHPLYGRLKSFDDAKVFSQYHVFAVWDFFSLLKRLQREVTCVDTPWIPRGMSDHARFILDIVIAEESDEAIDTGYVSHFELYLSAMEEIGADQSAINSYLSMLKAEVDPLDALGQIDVPPFVRDFVTGTLTVALTGEPHEVAASFCHGRENLLADVLTGVQVSLGPELDRAPILKHYLERHITLDHDEHGPLALRLLDVLCSGEPERIEQANRVGVEAIQARERLWDGILAELEST
jgi:hypothetical protein